MHQAGPRIHPDVCFQAEEPLVALARLVHRRVAALVLVLVLRRRRRSDDGARGQPHSVLLQVVVDRREQAGRQIVAPQQVPKLVDCGPVRRTLAAKVDPDETPHGL